MTFDTQQAQTDLTSQLRLSPGRELLRAVMATSANERDFPQLSMGCSLSPNPDQVEMSNSGEAHQTQGQFTEDSAQVLMDHTQAEEKVESQHLQTSKVCTAQTNLLPQLMLSPGRELLRAVMITSTNEREFPQLSMGCSLSPNPDHLEMPKSDEAHPARGHPVQVFIRYGKDVGAFVAHDIADLWTIIRKRWRNLEEGYELTPRFDVMRNDAEYFSIKRVNCPNPESSKSGLELKNAAQNAQIQVVVYKNKEVNRFEVTGKEDLWKQMAAKWGIHNDQYRLTPTFDPQKSGASYSALFRIQGGRLNPMQDLRPRFGYWYREDHGSQFCRFWYREQVCDAYLENWIAEELIARIQEEDPDATEDLKVWRKGDQVMGSFEWDDIGLSVSNEPPEDDEYPDLWRWEVEIDAMAASVLMRISPVHPIADALRGVEILWGCGPSHEWVAWGPVGPFVETECRDGLTVRIRDLGEGMDPSEARVLVHCEGQE
jgi:hypothetical protein